MKNKTVIALGAGGGGVIAVRFGENEMFSWLAPGGVDQPPAIRGRWVTVRALLLKP